MSDNAPMKNNPFQVLGPTVPPLLGRRDLIDKVRTYLDKERPEHVVNLERKVLSGQCALVYRDFIHQSKKS